MVNLISIVIFSSSAQFTRTFLGIFVVNWIRIFIFSREQFTETLVGIFVVNFIRSMGYFLPVFHEVVAIYGKINCGLTTEVYQTTWLQLVSDDVECR